MPCELVTNWGVISLRCCHVETMGAVSLELLGEGRSQLSKKKKECFKSAPFMKL